MDKQATTTPGRIDVFSCGTGFPQDAPTLALLCKADTVFGSRALLKLCPVPLREARVIGAAALENAAEALAFCRSGRRVAVLASGDALFHGFGGTLATLSTPHDNIVYHPGITAFQALFHRLGLPWQEARLFSVHAGETPPLRTMTEAPLAVIYAGSRTPAHAIARAILNFHPPFAERPAVMAERLGTPEERLYRGTLTELAQTPCGPTSMLVLLPCCSHSATSAPTLPLGLPEESYLRENNLITASDVRAVILSRLRLPAWGTLWDIGAGSGSVGLEAAALRPNLRVFGIERKPERGTRIGQNQCRLGVTNYTLHLGEALSLIGSPLLPAPDRVFIGGGGRELPKLLDASMNALLPNGIIVVSAVTLESFHTLYGWNPALRSGLCALDVAQEHPLAGTSHHLKPQNTIHLFTFQKEARS